MSPKTQRELILKHLMACLRITDLAALDLYKCRRLAARIWDLRQPAHGAHPIEKVMVKVGAKHVAEYYYDFSQAHARARRKPAGPQGELVIA